MTTDPADILKQIEREKARIRQETEALERKEAEVKQLIELAAKYKMNVTPAATPDLPTPKTISDLISIYKSLPTSPYQELSHVSQTHYDTMLGYVERSAGPDLIADLTASSFEELHRRWSEGGKLATAYSKIKMVRIIFGFGTEVLHDRECERLFGILCKLKFAPPKARNERLTKVQANLIRAKAREMGRPSVALAQAFQSDTGMLQKDVIGAWVPLEEQTKPSDITANSTKWVRGIRWNEIEDDMVLRHKSEGWQDNIEFDLRNAPMVLDELKRQYDFTIDRSPRNQLPRSGPIIKSEYDGLPWEATEFRRWWRICASACGVPENVRNSDSRSRIKNNAQDHDDGESEERRAVK